jgi:lipoyl-dependent peroxiredoxin subunit D
MDLTRIKTLIPDYAKDLKLNLSSVLTPEGAPGLTQTQILATALASAIAARNPVLLAEIETLTAGELDAAQINAARAAASIMGMNNVYYRFTHLVENDEYAKLPAKLRMNVIGNPGVDKTDFELYSLAVSAINGCGACVASHEKVVRKAGLGAEAVQSAVRIAAVVHGIAVALESSALPAGASRAAA